MCGGDGGAEHLRIADQHDEDIFEGCGGEALHHRRIDRFDFGQVVAELRERYAVERKLTEHAGARLSAIWQQAKDDYEAQEVNVRSEVREAQAALSATREAVTFSQTNLLPLRRQILQQTLLHYNAMQKDGYDLLLAREHEQQSEQTVVEAARDYWLARVSLERAVGGRLTAETNAPPPVKSSAEPMPGEHHHH